MHKLNNAKEIRIGNFLVDSYGASSKTVYEFQVCYYHYCQDDCPIVKKIKSLHWLKKLRILKSKILERKNSSFIWDINTYLFNNVTFTKK